MQFYAFTRMELERLRLRQLAGPGAWGALNALLQSPDGLTQDELISTTDRSQAAVSRAIAALVRAELVAGTAEPTGHPGRPPVRWRADRQRWERILDGE